MAVYARRDDPSRMSAVYATQGVAVRMGNFNGTAPEPTNFLCGYKAMDLTPVRFGRSVLDADCRGVLLLTRTKAGGGKKATRHVLDFSGADDLAAVRPDEIIAALNGASPALPDMEAAYSNAARCVSLACRDPGVLFVEAFGALAGALGFGGGEAWTSYGSFFLDFITGDDTISAAPAGVSGESAVAELMGGHRKSRTAVSVNAERGGADYAVSVKCYSPLIRQFFEGGELVFGGADDDFDYRYSPVPAGRRPSGKIEFFNVMPRHAKSGETDVNTIEGLIVERVYAGTPVMKDDTRGAASLTSFNFTLQARLYRDAAGNEVEQPQEMGFKQNSGFILALMKCLESPCLISQVEVEAASSVAAEPSVAMAKSSRSFAQCSVLPAAASGYAVEISSPGALGAEFSWNGDDQRVVITSGPDAGTETVFVKIANVDGTEASCSFALTVA